MNDDGLALTRIDCPPDNLVLLLYPMSPGVLIVLIGRFGVGPAPDPTFLAGGLPLERWLLKGRPYYSTASQLLLGGLFSTHAIFLFPQCHVDRYGHLFHSGGCAAGGQ